MSKSTPDARALKEAPEGIPEDYKDDRHLAVHSAALLVMWAQARKGEA